MAFAIRRMFSNITYFKKSEDIPDNVISDLQSKPVNVSEEPITINYNYNDTEPDSTSRKSSSLKLPESLKNYAAKKGSLSDTDIFNINVERNPREKRRKCKKLKVDIKKASQSMNQLNNLENTPKHILLECKSSDIFSERFKGFDFNKSFELFESTSDERISLFDDELGSFSGHSDSDTSVRSKSPVKMCRKVKISNSKSSLDINQLVPSVSPDSFADIETGEEEYTKLFQDYMLKFHELEDYTRKLLNNFQFHIDVSKLFSKVPNGNIKNANKIRSRLSSRDISPAGSWNIINTDEDDLTKCKLKKQLLSIKNCIDDFVHENLNNKKKQLQTNSTYGRQRKSYKKKIKHYDFPDLRDALINLFQNDINSCTHENGLDFDEYDCTDCHCKCHRYSLSQSDSGLTSKSQDLISITSSIGNFSLDSTTLTAYSESLDQIISYNSFQDTSLYNTLMQKAAVERITFYVQVHSIQIKCDPSDNDCQDKTVISFHCILCKYVETDENGLLRHILSQSHCEKIHFAYKTAYIKKCMSEGKEIQPSTVLNPMTMYRDDNKIVCFGEALYACSLCFENLIIGESVLMAHCAEAAHVDRRERLSDIIG